MAILVVHTAQSTGAATGNVVFGVTATIGNFIGCMIQQTAVAAPPKVKDNISGETGWTVEAETAEASATSTVYFAWKKAAGGETELTATPGSTSTVVGVSYLEASGVDTTSPIDVIKGTVKQAASETHESGLISPTNANCLIFACGGFGASSMETVEWTASTSGVMTTFTTAKARTSNAYLLLSGTPAQHYTVKIKTSVAGAVLVVALKPAAGGKVIYEGSANVLGRGVIATAGKLVAQGVAVVKGKGLVATSAKLVAQGQAQVLGRGLISSTGKLVATGRATINAGGLTSTTGKLIAVGKTVITGGGSVKTTSISGTVFEGSARITGGGAIATKGIKIAQGAARIQGGGQIVTKGILIATGRATIFGAGKIVNRINVTFNGRAIIIGGGTVSNTIPELPKPPTVVRVIYPAAVGSTIMPSTVVSNVEIPSNMEVVQ